MAEKRDTIMGKSEQPDVELGQIYREKDSRFVRYVTVVGFRERRGETRARIRTCLESGKILNSWPRNEH